MAGILTDLMTEKLIDVEEVFERVNPQEYAAVVRTHRGQKWDRRHMRHLRVKQKAALVSPCGIRF